MAQHDYVLESQAGASFRADLNAALQAIVSLNSGSTEPATAYAFMPWADTTTGLLKVRNADNDAWITVGELGAATLGLLSRNGGAMTGSLTMTAAMIAQAKGASVTAAATTSIWAADGNFRHVTGNATITSFGTAPQAGSVMQLIFDGTPTLTQSANLNLNSGGSNVTIEAGDTAIVVAETTTQMNVVVVRKSGKSIVPTLPSQAGNAGKALVTNGSGESWGYPSQLSTASGSAPSYAARAWVNFNGVDNTIRGSGNVSSITDFGAGNYLASLTTAMPDTNGSIQATGGRFGNDTLIPVQGPNAYFTTTSAIDIACGSDTSARSDWLHVYIAVFR